MNVEFFNYSKILKDSEEDLVASLKRCIGHGSFILGEEVLAFEEVFSKKVGSKYCIGMSNGTDSLTSILESLNLPYGSEVIVPAFTFIASASVILKAGLKPVFVDLKAGSFSASIEFIENKLTDKTSAVIFVHLFGEHNDLSELSDLCNDRSIYLIEDCAQSFGAPNGNYGIAGSFSFFPAKNLGCLGDGGAVVTNNKQLFEKLNMVRKHGMSKPYSYELLGGNYRLDALQAAFLMVLLKKSDSWINRRRDNARFYMGELQSVGDIILPRYSDNHSFNQFTIMTDKRDALKSYLATKGVSSNIYYPEPLYDNKIFDNNVKLENTEFVCKRVLSIPIYPGLEDCEREYVAECIKGFFNEL